MNLKNKLLLLKGPLNIIQANIGRLLNLAIKPKILVYSVTWRCNANCLMCDVRNMDSAAKLKERELTVADVERIFKDKLLNSLDIVRFTGGEPFLKENFKEIVYTLWKEAKPQLIYIVTNASYPERIKDFLEFFSDKDIKINLQISLDAAGPVHDKIRLTSGLFDKVITTLNLLKESRRKMPLLSVGINQTIVRDNMNEIYKLNDLAREYGFKHHVFFASRSHESKAVLKENRNIQFELVADFSRQEVSQLLGDMENIINKEKEGTSLLDTDFFRYIIEKYLLEETGKILLDKRNWKNLPCQALFSYFRLQPDGEIIPCALKQIPVGNLKNASFSEVWTSHRAKDVRKEIKSCPGCWAECDVVSNFIYSWYFLRYTLKKLLSH